MRFKFEEKTFNDFIITKQNKINNLINKYFLALKNNSNDKDDIKNTNIYNQDYNTNGFQISKSFEYEILEE